MDAIAARSSQGSATAEKPTTVVARGSALSLKGVRKSFAGTTAIHQLDLHTREGEFISLLGPSGCGKTTTLRCVAGFEYPESGQILIDGRDVSGLPPERRDIGMVFQNYALFPHLNVRRNLAFGLEMRRVPAGEIARRVEQVLAMVQLTPMADRFPRQLSGGQQQRVALARALVIEPRLLLLDEPLANLDAVLREDMRIFIRELQQRVGITTLYVTHDQAEAMVMSDRVAVMLGGRLQQFDEPEAIYLRPRTLDVARFIGRSNVIAAHVLAENAALSARAGRPAYRLATAMGEIEAVCGQPLAEGQGVHVAVRPEGVLFDDSPGALRGEVRSAYFLGSTVEHGVRCAGDVDLLVQTPPAQRANVGDTVGLRIDALHAWIIAGGATESVA